MDFDHFETLVRGTLQRELTEPGLFITINVREEGGRWIAEVVAPGRGAARESVSRGVSHQGAVAHVAKLIRALRALPSSDVA